MKPWIYDVGHVLVGAMSIACCAMWTMMLNQCITTLQETQ